MDHPQVQIAPTKLVLWPNSFNPTNLIGVIMNCCDIAAVSLSDQHGALRSISHTSPSHYTLRIQSFSQLTRHSVQRYISADFQAGGYKWKLALYPNGNKDKDITDHISLYLVFADADLLGPGGQIRAVFRLFMLDQNRDTYLNLGGGASENGRRFHRMKLEWGFDKFIPHADFKDPANGYLVNDTCVFGAEVYVCQEELTAQGECLSMVKDAISYRSTWMIPNYSSLTDDCVESKPFTAGDIKWKIQLYPLGKGSGAGSHVSLFLTLAEPENLPPVSGVYAQVTLRMLDRRYDDHVSRNDDHWFSASNPTCGWPRFVSQGYFYGSASGLLVNNICVVEAEVIVHGVTNAL